ncbi:MAG: phosphate acyltransferase PlsX [Pseudomonadota bacterium]
MKIAVDAMGGDRAPQVVVEGALEAAKDYGLSVILVGDQETVNLELEKAGGPMDLIEVHHASQVAGMAEAPVEVLRQKKDSSVRVAFNLVKSGQAQAAVSAGNTGAALAVGTVVLGRMPGVERPGIAGVFPTLKGKTVVIDVGANVDCRPSFLYQFALMGEAYASEILGVQTPRIGLLSVGEEPSKGNDLVIRAHHLFREGPFNFIGNIEGRDIFAGAADVIVCDGFVGNVVLKLTEGVAEAIGIMLKKELKAGLVSSLGSLLSYGAFKRFKKKMDYSEFGGAPLLGINGVGIISHGGSTPKAIKNAIRTAAEMVRADLPAKVLDRIRRSKDEGEKVGPDSAEPELDNNND